MSDHESPNVEVNETNNPDLLSQQSGMPNMSSTKKFTVDTDMQVNGDLDVTGTVTATSFIGDGSQLTGIVGGGVGLDSAGVTLLVDSDYVQARETPQDFAYSSLTGAPTALSSFTNDTNFVDSVGVISAVTSSDLDMGGNKVLFSNVYPTEADLPDATANHGMFAHVHATGAGYFAHAGSWVQLANDADIPVGGGLDSAGVTALINEPYLRDTLYDVATAQTNIGLDAGFASTSNFSIAIGKESGINSGNATNSIALGFKAGQSISDNSIMIGRETGEVGAGSYSVGIGTEALGIGAGAGSVAIGYFASRSSAGSNSVAVGRQSSATGDNAIAIGNTVTATTADAVTIGSSVAGRVTYDTTTDWTFGATVNAPAFVGDGSQLTGVAEPLSPQFPSISPYYYIYVGDLSAKLEGINDMHYGSDAEYDFRYDQEFESIDEAFKFVQESNFESVAWSDWRLSWVKTRIVLVFQNGRIFTPDEPSAVSTYLSLTHIKNHVIFTTQYAVDRDGTIDTSVTGQTYIGRDVNISYCPHIHFGGDIGWHYLQANGSNIIRFWANSYNENPYVHNLWAIRGSHVYIDGIVSEVEAEENTYCKIWKMGRMPTALKTAVEAAGISVFEFPSAACEADENSSIFVLNGYNVPGGIRSFGNSKVHVFSNDDIVIGDPALPSSFSRSAIYCRGNSEVFIESGTFNPNDATLMPNLVIDTGTLTDPTPEDNAYITIDWSSKFIRSVPIDATNAVGVQVLDGEILVRPNTPVLP